LKRVRWSPAAADDLERIADYLRENHPHFLESTIEKLYRAAVSLRQFPNRGRWGKLEGSRELVLPRLPYIIVYSVDQQLVNILRIMHTSPDWP
jgi:addiction module RelE/StbE family toxin